MVKIRFQIYGSFLCIIRYVALLLAVSFLSACGFFTNSHSEITAPRRLSNPTSYTADAYIEHLSIAKIKLSQNPLSDVESDIAVIQAYSAQKKQHKTLQPLVIMSYVTSQNNASQQAVVPLVSDATDTDFSDLLEITALLAKQSYTLHDVKVVVAQMPLIQKITDREIVPNQVSKTVERRLAMLMQRTQSLPALDEVRAQLRLTRFFTHNLIRDAAYLSLEDAKQTLASIHVTKENMDDVKNLSIQLETAEIELRTKLPYTIAF